MRRNRKVLQFRAGTPASSYPASVVAKSLQSVWDYNVTDGINASGVGPRYATNKTLGVDTLPAGCTFSSGYLIIGANATFDRWDFGVAGLTVAIYVEGSTGYTVTFNDCKFTANANDPAVSDTQQYGLRIGADGRAHTVNVNYCQFDGGRYNSNVGVDGPWNGSAIYVGPGACTLNIDHSVIKGCGYDVIKSTNSTLNLTNSRLQAFGWNQNSDADGIQMIGGLVTVEDNLWDIRDGGLEQLGSVIPGYQNQAIFCTIDTPSTMDGTPVVRRNIFVGWGGYGTSKGTPYTVVSVADNHTAGGLASGFNIKDGVWENNIFEPGNSGATLGIWTQYTTQTPAYSIASWTGNIRYADSSSIATPSW